MLAFVLVPTADEKITGLVLASLIIVFLQKSVYNSIFKTKETNSLHFFAPLTFLPSAVRMPASICFLRVPDFEYRMFFMNFASTYHDIHMVKEGCKSVSN